MEELERRVLERLLLFCQDRQIIGPYRMGYKSVRLVVGDDYRSFDLHEAFRFLLVHMDEEGLTDEFDKTLSA